MRRKIEVKQTPVPEGLDIRLVPLSMLNPAKYNPRKDLQPGDKRYTQLEKSIKEFGNVDPIIWNERTGNVVGGHQRLKILKQGKSNGDKLEVSVVNLPERKEKMLNIALNKISGDWDNVLLKSLIENIDLEDFEMDVIGFDRDEIVDLFGLDGGKYEREKFNDIIDKFEAPGEKKQSDKDGNWFYVEYYGEDEKFSELKEILGCKGGLVSEHQIDPDVFMDMVKESL